MYSRERDCTASSSENRDAPHYRPMTPGEEEIMRIYEDGIYLPPDMIKKPGGLQIKRLGRSCSVQTAHDQLVVGKTDPDSLLEELLRDSPEPDTPPVRSPTTESPLTPRAARVNPGAVEEPAISLDAVVDQLQTVVERLLPWLKDDISSSDSSNPRTPSPDRAKGDIRV
jgi:hypothetical protein